MKTKKIQLLYGGSFILNFSKILQTGKRTRDSTCTTDFANKDTSHYYYFPLHTIPNTPGRAATFHIALLIHVCLLGFPLGSPFVQSKILQHLPIHQGYNGEQDRHIGAALMEFTFSFLL